MATGAASMGQIGLTQNVGKRESARQNIAVMSQMVQMKQQQEAQEMQAAQIEQEYYDKIRQQADMMLSEDRNRINLKSKNIQSQIAQQIKGYGGSRAKFMQNGGVAMIGEYTNQVLNSDEVAIYKQNKINLEKIIEAKDKGFGSQVAARDQQSLEDYKKYGYGEITYSGLKNKVNLEFEKILQRGEITSPIDVLFHKDNYMNILGNYKIDKPNEEPPIEDLPYIDQVTKLLAYTNEQGWVGKGELNIPNQNVGDGRGTGKGPGNQNPGVRATKTGTLADFMRNQNPNIPLSEMNDSPIAKNQFLVDNIGNNPYNVTGTIPQTIGDRLAQRVVTSGSPLGWAIYGSGIGTWDKDNAFKARGAIDMGNNFNIPLWKAENGKDTFEIINGTIKNLDPNALRHIKHANGVPSDDKDKLPVGDYKVIGSFIGYEMKARDEDETYLIVDAVDKNGKIDKDRNSDMYMDDYDQEKIEGRAATYITLQGPDGTILHQRVDIVPKFKENDLANAIGKESNDVTGQDDENRHKRQVRNAAGQKVDARTLTKPNFDIKEINNFEANANFNAKVENINKYGGTTKRSDLMKAYYTAQYDDYITQLGGNAVGLTLDDMVNQDLFSGLIKALGLENQLYNLNLNDKDILDMMTERILTDKHSENDDIKDQNFIMMERIKNYFNNLLIPVTPKKQAAFGANFGFTPGSEWSIEKEFKGPSHSQGGIDINPKNL